VEGKASSPTVIRFGLFELSPSTGELRKRGIRIKLQEQPLRVLALLLENPGEPVTRERLRESLWPEDTFVDFDHSLNAAVAKLRQVLGDTAENSRFIETLPRRGYRFIPPVESTVPATEGRPTLSNSASEVPVSTGGAPPSRTWSKSWVMVVPTLILAALGIALTLPSRPKGSNRTFIRLTSDAGLTTDPMVSRDGRLLVYASDRGDSRLHVWVQQLSSDGQAAQVTRGDADEHQPAFSPDATKVAFRSEVNGGGIYVVPTLGGQPVLIAKSGRDPKFSPDGRLIAYWVGMEWSAMRGVAAGKVYVVGAGGESREISSALAIAGAPVWSPDGKHVLVFGQQKRQAHYHEDPDWWVLPIDGGVPVRTGAYAAFAREGMITGLLEIMPYPADWTTDGILFSAKSADSVDLWRVPVAGGSWQINRRPERLSSGAGSAFSASSSLDGRIVFANLSHRTHLWSLALDTNTARAAAQPEMLTDSSAAEYWPSVDTKGTRLAFTSTGRRLPGISLKDLETGKESQLPPIGLPTEYPKISPDGQHIAYTVTRQNGPVLHITQVGSALPEKVSEDCGWVWGWSPDGRYLLCKWGVQRRVRVLEIGTGTVSELLEDPNGHVFQANFSPDGRWITFLCSGELYIVPFRGPGSIAKQHWIKVVSGGHFDDKPRLSPDGNLLYFTSDRDGRRCLWAQRLDPYAKTPTDDPWPVYHFHAARRSLLNVGSAFVDIAVAPHGLIFPLDELTGNVWMIEPKR
jgi:Tol biopolymer transport system component/DNA-binding winged helix-turn-helix (wHTH) protein